MARLNESFSSDQEIMDAMRTGRGLTLNSDPGPKPLSVSTKNEEYVPSHKILLLVVRWAKKDKANFFENSLNTAMILAEELGFTLDEFFSLRGWAVQKSDGQCSPKVFYRSTESCLNEVLKDKPAARAKFVKFEKLVDRLYQLLCSHTLGLQDTTCDGTYVHTAKKHSVTKLSARKHSGIRNRKRGYFLHIHDRQSFVNRLHRETQHTQLAYQMVKDYISPVLTMKQRENPLVIFRWYKGIFGYHASRRDFLEGMMDLLILFGDPKKPFSKKNLKQWIQKGEASFMALVRGETTTNRTSKRTKTMEQVQLIFDEQFSKQGSRSHHSRSTQGDTIVRNYKVVKLYSDLIIKSEDNSGKGKKRKPIHSGATEAAEEEELETPITPPPRSSESCKEITKSPAAAVIYRR
jgi:hypothetical protein